ncbi:MAG: gamma-glutamyl-gamma-aminobutyrate hydrolase family protein [Chloroflexi bacterium]|nr:gamma-glutamyl-gamma-aminobutyrate hydrolase family protein [Chloroflexota bacterium]
MRPVIGIPSIRSLSSPYAGCIERAGGEPLILRAEDGPDVSDLLRPLDGLVFPGGTDIHPRFYGQAIDPAAGVKTDEARDIYELALLEGALDLDIPILAICRGMQLLNVALRGSLLQRIDGHRGSDEVSVFHDVQVEAGSILADLVGSGVRRVNSRHHQGLREAHLAPGLAASAVAPDGIIEGIESKAHRFVVSVQCHPERSGEVDASFAGLFRGLVAQAERTRQVAKGSERI